MSDTIVIGDRAVREVGAERPAFIATDGASRDRASEAKRRDAVSEHVAVAVVALMLSGGFMLAWQMLRGWMPHDASLGWAGIAFRTNAIGTAAVAAVAVIRGSIGWVVATRRQPAG